MDKTLHIYADEIGNIGSYDVRCHLHTLGPHSHT